MFVLKFTIKESIKNVYRVTCLYANLSFVYRLSQQLKKFFIVKDTWLHACEIILKGLSEKQYKQ